MLRFIGCLLVCALLAVSAWADDVRPEQPAPRTTIGKKEEGFFFTADKVEYDDQNKIMRAAGHVEITNGKRVVQADKLVYDMNRKIVTATGNVTAVETSGDVVFSDSADISDDFENAFAKNVSVLLVDNSRMTARVAERTDGTYMNMAQATYSPCDLCAQDPNNPPLWQVKAERVHHSMVTHDVTYEDAWLQFWGYDTLYLPRFSHPDPGVKSRTGFLTPKAGYSSNLGTFAKVPYFFDMTPDLDITLTPTFSEKDGLQTAAEFRKRWRDTSLRVDGSVAQTKLTEENGSVRDNQTRGHVRGEFDYEVNEYWRTGADVALTSDKTYLDRYRIGTPDVLTNRAFVEGFQKRDYIGLESIYFQDTRPGIRLSQPYVLPRLQAEAIGKPGGIDAIGGRWKLNSDVVMLERPKDKLDTKRFSTAGGWERTDILRNGLVTKLNTDARVDTYVADNYTEPTSGVLHDQTTRGRFFPSASATVRYPLARQFGTVQHTVEPIVQALVAPVTGDTGIPNEDSQDFEFDHTNLFRASRFTGVDRLEGGARATYGVRTGVYGYGGGSASAFVGQSYRLRRDTSFSTGSGLEKRSSDYVGNVTLDPAPWLFFDYNWRVDQATLQPRKHDLKLVVGSNPLRFETNYVFVDSLTGTANGRSREEIASSLNYYFEKYWNVFVAQSRQFKPQTIPLTTSLGVSYADECINYGLTASRDHTVRTGLKNGTTFFFHMILKNLGGIQTPVNAGDVFNQDQNR